MNQAWAALPSEWRLALLVFGLVVGVPFVFKVLGALMEDASTQAEEATVLAFFVVALAVAGFIWASVAGSRDGMIAAAAFGAVALVVGIAASVDGARQPKGPQP